ncbi:hypothetical protein [Brevundimonas naejangsanensis]|nr:hypothetical protein [Brevundimonas naejangsanensis]
MIAWFIIIVLGLIAAAVVLSVVANALQLFVIVRKKPEDQSSDPPSG